MPDQPYVIVDIETTGTSAKHGGITEIAAMRIENGMPVRTYTSLINPGAFIPSQITSLTGITNEMVQDAPRFEEVAHELSTYFEGAHFLAHYAVFDISFVKKAMEEAGICFKPKILCSVKLSRALYPHHKGHSLQKIIERHNIATKDRHRALADVQAVFDFIKIAEAELGPQAIHDGFAQQLKQPTLPSNFDPSQLEEIENTPGVYIFKDMNDVPVYIGKSKTLRTRILSHFSQASSVSKELKISQKTHKLEVLQSDSEIEALLLESKLVKELLPIHNIKLRKKREQTILLRETTDDGYFTITAKTVDISEIDDPTSIFGTYDTRLKAKSAIEKAMSSFDLCGKILGLEKSKGSCFRYQLGKCKGACIRRESIELYNLRVDLAFQRSRIQSWKFGGPIRLAVSNSKELLVDQWLIFGEITKEESGDTLSMYDEIMFDIDSYKILRSFIRDHAESINDYCPEQG